MRKNCIIIPALEPDEKLYEYIVKLRECTRSLIVVVDDGSGPGYHCVFDRIKDTGDCVVLKHDVNRGKGRALKTAFAYLMEHVPEVAQMVCVDCDGQHAPGDVFRIFRAAREMPGALHLGGRDFSGKEVPFRSWFGNRVTTCLFWLVCGKWIDDTQTGLRAFDRSLLPEMLSIPGERFEYETQMLLTCVKDKIPIRMHRIQTIYEEGNGGSHFRPVKDSIRVLRILFSEMIRFGMSSLFCAALDVFLFWRFSGYLLRHEPFSGADAAGEMAGTAGFLAIAMATLCARIISACVNYILNRDHVFQKKPSKHSRLFWSRENMFLKYAALCMGIGLLSTASVYLLSRIFPVGTTTAKVISDLVLFFVSYRMQKSWVFRGGREETQESKKEGDIYE